MEHAIKFYNALHERQANPASATPLNDAEKAVLELAATVSAQDAKLANMRGIHDRLVTMATGHVSKDAEVERRMKKSEEKFRDLIQRLREADIPLCQTCDSDLGQEPHGCDYANCWAGGEKHRCNCCDECQSNCTQGC